MKRLLVLFMLSIVTCTNAQSSLTLSEAKEIANIYYGSLQQMAKHPYGDIRIENERRLFGIMGVDENGNTIAGRGEVPNDLVGLEGKQVEDNRPLQIRSYITRFLRIAEEKKMDFSYKVLSNDYQPGPEMPEIKKTDETPLFARVVVQKTIKSSSFPMTQINDTMLINTRNRAIWITNKYRKSSESNYKNKTINELLAEAQNMYSSKRYNEAYRLYQKVLEKDPRHAEASYSLGVMSFKGEGCKQYPRKVRDYLAVFYWQKSEKGLDELGRLNNNLPERITSFSGLESNPFPSNRLLAYDRNKNRLGYISAQGKMAVEQQYKYAYPFFENGTALVKSEKDEWFLIDTTGKVKDVYLGHNIPKSGQQLVVHKMGKSGVVNRKTGEWEVPFDYQITGWDWEIIGRGAGVLHYYVTKNGKRGLISSKNDMIVPAIYDNLRSVDYKEDKITLLCNYDQSSYDQLLKRYEKDYKIPVDELKRIGTILKLDLPNFTNGLAIVEVLESDKREWQLMDTTGKVRDTFELLIGLGFENLDMVFHEFKKEGKYGLLWPDYRVLLPATSKDVILPTYYSGGDWVWFIYDVKEPAYSRLEKKYGSVEKIPENELKKVATILKVNINNL